MIDKQVIYLLNALIMLIFHYPILHKDPIEQIRKDENMYTKKKHQSVFTTVIGVRSDGSLKISANADEYRS